MIKILALSELEFSGFILVYKIMGAALDGTEVSVRAKRMTLYLETPPVVGLLSN